MSATDGRLGFVIKRAEQALIARKSAALREFGLTVPQYAALLLLAEAGDTGMSAAQLARESLVTPQTMATVLTNLETKALIERGPSPLHQKVVVNRLTAAGAALLTDADDAALRVERHLSAAFTEPELAAFTSLLERAVAALTATRS
ncbi:MarR family winged helix-turn-helix transcriptional regulator [Actinoplanes utahensis]|uniref:MarR family transcriptional regulator n=1 Tax=Actinoplanes utahensis TaxID=1869 RepID=A0A0A6UGB9_ACTUT|nr:MarR family transcriptional regulator [Actinoplanes utahensis]KHD73344.1 MarR family transcriptional regulator [Actinoplanes utahensis]GIF30086.1 MarR family transcriptional regulator [Actinoplanes utahensis]